MVSTPIGAPNIPADNSYAQYNVNVSTAVVSSQSPLANQTHSFPVLYTNSPMGTSLTTIPSDATPSPISLYSEYIGNPYTLPNNAFSIYGMQPLLVYQNQQEEQKEENVSVNSAEAALSDTQLTDGEINQLEKNSGHCAATNIFQSSNYFYTDTSASNIPVGSEILFGTNNKA